MKIYATYLNPRIAVPSIENITFIELIYGSENNVKSSWEPRTAKNFESLPVKDTDISQLLFVWPASAEQLVLPLEFYLPQGNAILMDCFHAGWTQLFGIVDQDQSDETKGKQRKDQWERRTDNWKSAKKSTNLEWCSLLYNASLWTTLPSC